MRVALLPWCLAAAGCLTNVAATKDTTHADPGVDSNSNSDSDTDTDTDTDSDTDTDIDTDTAADTDDDCGTLAHTEPPLVHIMAPASVLSTADAALTLVDDFTGAGPLLGSADLTGDGRPDIAVASSGWNAYNYDLPAGAIHIIDGDATGEFSPASAASMTIEGGVRFSALGAPMVQGDLDGDGNPELVTSWGGYSTGIAGQVSAFSTPLTAATEADAAFRIEGGHNMNTFGRAMAVADLDGDGIDDLVVGAAEGAEGDRGAVFLFAGGLTGGLADDLATAIVRGNVPNGYYGDGFGYDVAVGDLTCDGIPDLVVSALHSGPGTITTGGTGYPILEPVVGAVYVFEGPIVGELTTDDAILEIQGISEVEALGLVSVAGDLNDDGVDDLVIGSWTGEALLESGVPGRAYIVYGPIPTGVHNPADIANVTLVGDAPADGFGGQIDGVGDVDGDGIDDLIVGARWNESSHLIFGPIAPGLPVRSVRLEGTNFGSANYGLGDVTGDGLADFAVAADGVGTYDFHGRPSW